VIVEINPKAYRVLKAVVKIIHFIHFVVTTNLRAYQVLKGKPPTDAYQVLKEI